MHVHVDAAADLAQRGQRLARPTPSASTALVVTSTILKVRGKRGSGSGSRRLRGGGTNNGSSRAAGFLTTLSRGTISAPVPLVPVSSTQTLLVTYRRLALLGQSLSNGPQIA